MSAIKRVKKFIDFKAVPVSTFEKNISMSNNSIQTAIKRESGVKDDVLNKILNFYPEINAVWLLTGEGEMLNSDKKPEIIENEDVHSNGKGIVPYYDNNGTASIVSSYSDEIEEPAFYVNYQPFNDCTAYINCYGDSMFPKYKNGERIAIKKVYDRSTILWGEVYYIVTDMEANDLKTIKELHPHKDEDKVILRSSNPNYEGDTVIKMKNIIGLFIVKGKISQNFN